MLFLNFRSSTLLLALFFLLLPAFSNAQVGAGIKIVPAIIEDRIDPGESISKVLSVTNESNQEKEYFLFVRNIKGVEAGGRPIFAEETDEVTGYELKDWLVLETASIIVPPNGTVSVPVTINVPDSASPGSHFGGVFVSVEAPRLRTIGAGVGYEVASIISLRINGDVIDDARIRSFSTDKLIYGAKNVNFFTRIENQGNILIQPRGSITITNMFGSEVGKLPFNEDLRGIFPRTIRDDFGDIIWDDGGMGFGQYEAVIGLSYEGNGGQRTIDAAVSFWILPFKIIVPVLIGLLVFLGLVFLFVRIYISRAMQQSQSGRRIAPQRYRKQVGMSRFAFVFAVLLIVVALALIILLILLA